MARTSASLRDADYFDAWLRRILVNTCRTQIRARGRVREISIDATFDRSVAGPGTSDQVSATDLLGRAFDRLDAAKRSIIVLHYLEHDLAFEGGGALVLSTGSRIRRIDRLGLISTIAGKDGIGQNADGIPATQPSFGEIGSLAVDELGDLFLADGLRTVYRIDPKGIITRFAGKGP